MTEHGLVEDVYYMSSKMYVVRLCCRCYWRYVFQSNALKFYLPSLVMLPRASQTARYSMLYVSPMIAPAFARNRMLKFSWRWTHVHR